MAVKSKRKQVITKKPKYRKQFSPVLAVGLIMAALAALYLLVKVLMPQSADIASKAALPILEEPTQGSCQNFGNIQCGEYEKYGCKWEVCDASKTPISQCGTNNNCRKVKQYQGCSKKSTSVIQSCEQAIDETECLQFIKAGWGCQTNYHSTAYDCRSHSSCTGLYNLDSGGGDPVNTSVPQPSTYLKPPSPSKPTQKPAPSYPSCDYSWTKINSGKSCTPGQICRVNQDYAKVGYCSADGKICYGDYNCSLSTYNCEVCVKPSPSPTPLTRQNICDSLKLTASTIKSGETITVTAAATIPVKFFYLALYNSSNATARMQVGGKDFGFGFPTSGVITPKKQHQFTLSYNDLHKPDSNWLNKYPTKVQINAYFTDTNNQVSLSNTKCVGYITFK